MKITDETEKQKRKKKTKTEKNKGMTQALTKRWELNDFAVRLR